MGKKIYKILDEIGYFDKWRAEGRAEGKIEGRIEARVETIIRVLSRRLKVPSKVLQKKISSVKDLTKLGELIDIASTCASLDEFKAVLR